MSDQDNQIIAEAARRAGEQGNERFFARLKELEAIGHATFEVPFGDNVSSKNLADQAAKILKDTHNLFGISNEDINNKAQYPNGVVHGRVEVTISVKVVKPFE
jgi:hypothetical protein